ncbi:MAG TPA: hypothetical protein PLR60_15175 [Syntrophorhabdaceae bacterium]|nr:hypothetical protein [Syntrophorhabdaceae bacterium]
MKREKDLIRAGWERRFVACEPRLSEVVEMYEEIGFEVRLEPLPTEEELDANDTPSCEDSECTVCFGVDRDRYRIIFTRPRA